MKKKKKLKKKKKKKKIIFFFFFFFFTENLCIFQFAIEYYIRKLISLITKTLKNFFLYNNFAEDLGKN